MDILSTLFLNEDIDEEIAAFCASDPEYLKIKQQFYGITHEIAKHVEYDLYDAFERGFNAYLFRTADLYYLFGLRLRQEILHAIRADG